VIRVLGRTSSINVRKVLWTLDELGLAYEREDWGLGFASTRDPALLALHPDGLLPVLIDVAGPLWESNTICRYLAARHGDGALLPVEARARAGVEQWMDWQATELNSVWHYAFQALSRRTPGFDDPARTAASVAAWNGAMSLLDARLVQTGGHVAGPTFTLADIGVGLATHRWLRTPMDRPALPAVEAYYAGLHARPAFGPHALEAVA